MKFIGKKWIYEIDGQREKEKKWRNNYNYKRKKTVSVRNFNAVGTRRWSLFWRHQLSQGKLGIIIIFVIIRLNYKFYLQMNSKIYI